MSTTLAPPIAAVAAPTAKRWLVGPWFDLFFVANLAWPIVALFGLDHAGEGKEAISFFQIYFLSTPHRWITLVLVFCDSDRFWKEPAKFGGVAAGLVLLGLVLAGIGALVPAATNTLVLLMMLDYIWNAWHFAAQHAGISRIYGRITRPDQSLAHAEFEKTALRILVLWVFFRFAMFMASHSAYSGNTMWLTTWLPWLDPLAVVPVVVLLAREIGALRIQSMGRLLYISSVIALYSTQLLALRLEAQRWMWALFLGGAVFHAVEYLAVCNWSVQKRTTGIWQYQITRTGLALFIFMAVLGIGNWLLAEQSMYAWALVTLLVSLLHYAYDGMIWRAKPAAKTV
jgi:hypothetical protein